MISGEHFTTGATTSEQVVGSEQVPQALPETVMKAAVYRGAGQVEIEEYARPIPGRGEVLVRVGVAGICGTDASEFTYGPQLTTTTSEGDAIPVVLGHEFTGTVDSWGPGVTGFDRGASVVCGAGVSCGECVMCRQGRTNLCCNYRTVGLSQDGGLAEYVSVPASTLLDVSESGLPFDTLALAQPLAVALQAVRRSGLTPHQDTVVIGAGGIGAFLTFAAVSTGARVLVVDLDPERLALATKLGATATLLAGVAPISEVLREHAMEPEVFFEVTGSTAGLASVLDVAMPGAVIVPVGIQKGAPGLPLGSWTLREYSIVGTVAHAMGADLPEAVRLLGLRTDWTDVTREVIPLDALVSDGLIPLSSGSSRQIKTLVDPWITSPRAPDHSPRPASVLR